MEVSLITGDCSNVGITYTPHQIPTWLRRTEEVSGGEKFVAHGCFLVLDVIPQTGIFFDKFEPGHSYSVQMYIMYCTVFSIARLFNRLVLTIFNFLFV